MRIMLTPTAVRSGFTLVEALVALMLFGLIAAAGTAVLSVSIDNRFAVRSATDRTASGSIGPSYGHSTAQET